MQTAVLLRRSVSCQDSEAHALEWSSCERDLFAAVPGSNPGRQTSRNRKSSKDRRRRSEAARFVKETIIVNVGMITQVTSTKDKSEGKENDLTSNTEDVSAENVENVSIENVENVSIENVVAVSKENVDNVSKESVENVSAYLSYDDFPELTSQECRPGVSKVRGLQRERPHRSRKKWRPVRGDIQLNFQTSLPLWSSSDQNGDATLKDRYSQSRRSIENESDMSQNESEIANSKSQEFYLEEDGSLKDQMAPVDYSCFNNDGVYDHDLMSFYFEKLPRCPPSLFPCEPYLPVCQQLRIRQKWKKTRARRLVKSKSCRTVENHPAYRRKQAYGTKIFRKSRERTPKYFDSYHNILLIDEDPYEYYDYRYDNNYYDYRYDNYDDRYDSCDYIYEDGRCPSNRSRLRWTPSQNGNEARPRSRFAMDAYNADGALSTDLVNVLINLQHRDLLPEDYDLLLRLDDRVTPKTVDPGVLSTMRTEVVVEADDRSGDVVCGVCMEPFERGQTTKYLPCGHRYHEACIDRWLTNSSQMCPLDGVSINVDPS